MPASLPWLDSNPLILGSTRLQVIGSVVFWLAALVVLYLALYHWKRRQPAVIASIEME